MGWISAESTSRQKSFLLSLPSRRRRRRAPVRPTTVAMQVEVVFLGSWASSFILILNSFAGGVYDCKEKDGDPVRARISNTGTTSVQKLEPEDDEICFYRRLTADIPLRCCPSAGTDVRHASSLLYPLYSTQPPLYSKHPMPRGLLFHSYRTGEFCGKSCWTGSNRTCITSYSKHFLQGPVLSREKIVLVSPSIHI